MADYLDLPQRCSRKRAAVLRRFDLVMRRILRTFQNVQTLSKCVANFAHISRMDKH
jgi:hypothetical protein